MARLLTRLAMGSAVALLAIPAAAARTDRAPLVLGVLGDAARFETQTGQRSTVQHVILSWSQGASIPKLLGALGPVPMLGIGTGGSITPLEIANGKGDDFLLALNAALADFDGLVYVRPLGEMNGHWNDYAAFRRDGSSKGPKYAPAAFRKAFARIYLFAHGGSKAALSRRLRALGLPGVAHELPVTRAKVVWNPQGYGSPDIPANRAEAFFPGNAYVDVVANDLYDQRFNAAWEANEALYDTHPTKPYAIAEWGLWGIDDPAFVERMAEFARSHPRVVFLAYFSGGPGSPWDLATKPRSRAAYRRLITPLA